MNIIIQDTGIQRPDYSSSDFASRFPTLETATDKQAISGRFRVNGQLTMKLINVNYGSGANDIDIPNLGTVGASKVAISKNPIKITIVAELLVPSSFRDTTKFKDVKDVIRVALLDRSRGHKDLYVVDDANPDREALTHLYQLTEAFGHTDPVGFEGNDDAKKHLNIKVDSVSANGGINTVTYNLNCTVFVDEINHITGL